MATRQGQDVVLCQLCPNPVEHHCNLCHVDLCPPCTLKHLADKTNRHEIVEFINRKEGPVLPECDTHKKTRCEMYCKDCFKPTCALCVTTTHKKHDFTDIREIVENRKKQIIADLAELENVIVPKYRNFTRCVPVAEFDRVLTAIRDQEEKICRMVRDTSSKLSGEVTNQKHKSEQKNKEIQSLAAETEKELNEIIRINKDVLKANDALTVLNYNSKNGKFRNGMTESGLSCPTFLPGHLKEDQINDMFGKLLTQEKINSVKNQRVLELMGSPISLKEIQSPYEYHPKLWKLACERTGKIWVSGDDCSINQIDWNGSVLRTFRASEKVLALSFDVNKDLLFIILWPDTKVYKYNNKVETLLDFTDWCPRGICSTVNGDLLVSMRSLDMKRSRVVRYSGTTEFQVIENDNKGNPLLSVGAKYVLHLTENGNGDICVADSAGRAVVVVNYSGLLRFNYKGNISKKAKLPEFIPLDIVHDEKLHVLISDDSNNKVHIIDHDGNFIRFIEYPCNGGISVDIDHNLVFGEQTTGKIQIIKYLE